MEALVTAALHEAVVHLETLLVFGRNWHLHPGTVGLLNGMHLLMRLFKLLLLRGGLQLQTLQRQLLDPVGQTAGAIFNLRPEVIPQKVSSRTAVSKVSSQKSKDGRRLFPAGTSWP